MDLKYLITEQKIHCHQLKRQIAPFDCIEHGGEEHEGGGGVGAGGAAGQGTAGGGRRGETFKDDLADSLNVQIYVLPWHGVQVGQTYMVRRTDNTWYQVSYLAFYLL